MEKKKTIWIAAGICCVAAAAAIGFQMNQKNGYFSVYEEDMELPVIREGSASSIEKDEERKEELRIFTEEAVGMYNPLFSETDVDRTVRDMVFEPLFRMKAEGGFEPVLAESVSVSEDGLVFQIRLKEGVLFSDETPMTAEDAAWSIAAYLLTKGDDPDYRDIEGAEAFLNSQEALPKGIRILSDRELMISFEKAAADHVRLLEARVQKADFAEESVRTGGGMQNAVNGLMRKGVGTGAYRFSEEYLADPVGNEGAVLVQNRNYREKTGDILRVYVETGSYYELSKEIEAGAYDLASWHGDSMMFDSFFDAERYHIFETSGDSLYGLFFREGKEAFENPSLRKAMAKALMGGGSVSEELSRYVSVKNSFSPKEIAVYDQKEIEKNHEAGMSKAKSLYKTALKELGTEGISLSFPVMKDSEIMVGLADYVTNALTELGMTVHTEYLTQDQYMRRLYMTEDYDIIIGSAELSGSFSSYEDFYHERGTLRPVTGEKQQAALSFFGTAYSPEAYASACSQMTAAMDEEVPFVLLGGDKRYLAVSADLEGYGVSPETFFIKDVSKIKVRR